MVSAHTGLAKWPKSIPPLTEEQRRISDDFMRYWHEVLPKKYGVVETFNHKYAVKHAPKSFRTTLEIGAGLGEHINYEDLTTVQKSNYYALELRENMAESIRQSHTDIKTICADYKTLMRFDKGNFDRILT